MGEYGSMLEKGSGLEGMSFNMGRQGCKLRSSAREPLQCMPTCPHDLLCFGYSGP